MSRREQLRKAREEKIKPVLIFDSTEYSISRIPLNYRIYIKVPKKGLRVSRDRYCSDEHPLSFVHELAKQIINNQFKN